MNPVSSGVGVQNADPHRARIPRAARGATLPLPHRGRPPKASWVVVRGMSPRRAVRAVEESAVDLDRVGSDGSRMPDRIRTERAPVLPACGPRLAIEHTHDLALTHEENVAEITS